MDTLAHLPAKADCKGKLAKHNEFWKDEQGAMLLQDGWQRDVDGEELERKTSVS